MKIGKMKKEQSYAFGKDVYLLGEDKDGIKYWLEAPSFDCGWYWGFGYVETYTKNNSPSTSIDINSHQHINSGGKYKSALDWFIKWNGQEPILTNTPFTDNEKWKLCELFERFYLFKKMTEFYHSGFAGMTELKLNFHKDKKMEDYFNQIVIKEVTDEIIKIVKPDTNKEIIND